MLVPVIAVAILVIGRFLWPHLERPLLGTWHKIKEGAGIFRDWRRYLTHVALPSTASYACRVGVNVVFMAAFGIPITAFTVLAVAASHMLCGIFAVTPGGVGEAQALDVFALRGYATPGSIAAFSITEDAVITIWNVVLGIVLVLWAFGFSQARQLFSRAGDGKSRQPVPGADSVTG